MPGAGGRFTRVDGFYNYVKSCSASQIYIRLHRRVCLLLNFILAALSTATNSGFLCTSHAEVSRSSWFMIRMLFWRCVDRRCFNSADVCPRPLSDLLSLTFTACPFICSAAVTEFFVLLCLLLGVTPMLLDGFTVCFTRPLSVDDFNCQLELSTVLSGFLRRPLLADFDLLPSSLSRRSSPMLERCEVAESAPPDVNALPIEVACCGDVDDDSRSSSRSFSAISCSWSSSYIPYKQP